MKATTYIPIVNLFASGAKIQSTATSFTFDQGGILQATSLSS